MSSTPLFGFVIKKLSTMSIDFATARFQLFIIVVVLIGALSCMSEAKYGHNCLFKKEYLNK